MIDWKIIYLFEILFSQQERTNDGTEATLTAISQNHSKQQYKGESCQFKSLYWLQICQSKILRKRKKRSMGQIAEINGANGSLWKG